MRVESVTETALQKVAVCVRCALHFEVSKNKTDAHQ